MNKLQSFLRLFMGRDSDPYGRSLRSDDPTSSVLWSLQNPRVVDTLRECVKRPIHGEALKIFADKRISPSYIQATQEIEKMSDGAIDISILPVNLQCVDLSDQDELGCLYFILNTCCNFWHSEKGDQKMLDMTSGKFAKIHCYRIMKCASSTMYGALRDVFVGKEMRRCYLPSQYFSGRPESLGYIGEHKTVDFSWSALGCATKSFNFSQSHYALHEYNLYPENVYKVISLRDPLSRIASFYNHLGKEKFKTLEGFVNSCHPHFMFGQLYFLDQGLSLSGAKNSLRQLNRVLIVEESADWSQQLSADLGQDVLIAERNKGNYVEHISCQDIRNKLEKLISGRLDLARLLDKEYLLYNYAKSFTSSA